MTFEPMADPWELAGDWTWTTDARHRLLEVRSCGRGTEVSAQLPLRWRRAQLRMAFTPAAQAMAVHRPFRAVEGTLQSAGSPPRHLLLAGMPQIGLDGVFLGYRGMALDLTRQRLAEAALDQSESQLAAVVDAATDAVVATDGWGEVTLFNQAASTMFGCSRRAALGLPLERWLPGLLEALGAVQTPIADSPGVLLRAVPIQARREDGSTFEAEVTAARIVHAGRREYCLAVRDVTQLNAGERQRQALEMQLRQAHKMESLGTLAGGIAHDFNNLVAAILGHAQLAQAACEPGSPVQEYLAHVQTAGRRARELVQRILAFSRAQPAAFQRQPLQPLVHEAVRLAGALLPPGIALVQSEPREPLEIRADATQIGQVLMNLLTNALQAIGPASGRIGVSLARDDGYARLSVSDTGCGMDEATAARVFEPFFSTKPPGEGTGLGLAMVQGIVRAHGGRIDLESVPGRGTTFHVCLPLADEPPRPVPASAPVPAGGGRRVLYVDDDPVIVLMMSGVLQAHGWQVHGEHDALAALAWFAGHADDIDLVICDDGMPRCTGPVLAQALKRHRPGLPVILASARVDEALWAEARRVGVREVFDKADGAEALCTLAATLMGPAGQGEDDE